MMHRHIRSLHMKFHRIALLKFRHYSLQIAGLEYKNASSENALELICLDKGNQSLVPFTQQLAALTRGSVITSDVEASDLSESEKLDLVAMLASQNPRSSCPKLERVTCMRKALQAYHRTSHLDRINFDGDMLDRVFGIESHTAELSGPRAMHPREPITVPAPPGTPECTRKQANCDVDSDHLLYVIKTEGIPFPVSSHPAGMLSCSSAVLNCARSSDRDVDPSTLDQDPLRPSLDQLMRIQENMLEQIPKVLVKHHDYNVYKPTIIFENNYMEKSYTTEGIKQYVFEISKWRILVHFKYANAKLSVVKSAIEEDCGRVRIQWRLAGIPQLRAFMFWKFLPGFYSKSMKTEAEYHEGISTFYVDNTGLIIKHQIDRVLSDEEKTVEEMTFVARLRAAMEPKPALEGTACK